MSQQKLQNLDIDECWRILLKVFSRVKVGQHLFEIGNMTLLMLECWKIVGLGTRVIPKKGKHGCHSSHNQMFLIL